MLRCWWSPNIWNSRIKWWWYGDYIVIIWWLYGGCGSYEQLESHVFGLWRRGTCWWSTSQWT
jgi:hypothetical protein